MSKAQHTIAFCSGSLDCFYGESCYNVSIDGLKIESNTIYQTDHDILLAAMDSITGWQGKGLFARSKL